MRYISVRGENIPKHTLGILVGYPTGHPIYLSEYTLAFLIRRGEASNKSLPRNLLNNLQPGKSLRDEQQNRD